MNLQFKLGFPRTAEENQIHILIITIVKVVIFRAKYKEGLPNIKHFLSFLKNRGTKGREKRHAEKNEGGFSAKMGRGLKNFDSEWLPPFILNHPLSSLVLLPHACRVFRSPWGVGGAYAVD